MSEPVFTLVDVNGVSHVLDGDALGIGVAPGARGLGMPEITPNTTKLAGAPGGALARVSTQPTTVDIPLFAQRSTAALLEDLLDNLAGWVLPGTERNATPSMVRFQMLASDGTHREIEGVCVGGLDSDDSLEVMGATWQDLILTLECPDPYPRDVVATAHTFTSGTGLTTWWPYYELQFMPSAVYAEETIANGGQIEAWPVITITGPGSNPTLTNLTTGEVLELSANGGLSLVAGETVTIDTNERGATRKTILDGGGANLWPYATPASDMWPLVVGDNLIRVQMDGATVASSVVLSFRRRWARGRRR